jgi:hypothetical protein
LSPCAAFLFGAVGGLIAEVASLSVHRLRNPKKWPKYMRYRRYWALGVCWVAIGGVIPAAHAFDGSNLSAWVCINLGLTAPLCIHTAMRAAPAGKPGKVNIEDKLWKLDRDKEVADPRIIK